MYKFANHLTTNNLVLVRRQLGDGSCAALIVMRSPVRHYAKHLDKTCEPASPRSKKGYFAIGATLLAGTAAVVYAKNSPKVRTYLANNVLWADDFIALVYQENTTYWQFFLKHFHNCKTSVTGFIFGKEGVTPLDFKQKAEQDIEADAKKFYAPRSYVLPPLTLEPLYIEEIVIETPDLEEPSTMVQTDKFDVEPPAPINITKDIVDLEQQMQEHTKVAIDTYARAAKHCDDYNRIQLKIIESGADADKRLFVQLKGFRIERDNAIEKAETSAGIALQAIETIEELIKSGLDAPPETKAMTTRFLNQFRADIKKTQEEFKANLDKANLADKYWDRVEAARKAYKSELESLFPGIDLCARTLDVKGPETDLLLVYTMKQVQFLINELAEMQTVTEQKLNKAIDCNDEKLLIDMKVEQQLKQEKIERELNYQKQALGIMADYDRKLRAELRKNYELHQDVMNAKLEKKEKELFGRFNRVVSEKLEADRLELKKQLAVIAGRMRAIETTLKKKAQEEADARRSQSLWAAAQALLVATRRPVPETEVKCEIEAVEKAGKNDKVVASVLKGIPADARENPISTECAIRERFDALERTAMNTALIGKNGASLPMYFLSWLMSKILFQKFAEIPKGELDNLPTDFSKLDTYDILQRARYHIDHNDISAALRYINLLQGAPRVAAKCWVESVRRHLEVRQAAETIMTHASLSSM